jgi:hypothetical protein
MGTRATRVTTPLLDTTAEGGLSSSGGGGFGSMKLCYARTLISQHRSHSNSPEQPNEQEQPYVLQRYFSNVAVVDGQNASGQRPISCSTSRTFIASLACKPNCLLSNVGEYRHPSGISTQVPPWVHAHTNLDLRSLGVCNSMNLYGNICTLHAIHSSTRQSHSKLEHLQCIACNDCKQITYTYQIESI